MSHSDDVFAWLSLKLYEMRSIPVSTMRCSPMLKAELGILSQVAIVAGMTEMAEVFNSLLEQAQLET